MRAIALLIKMRVATAPGEAEAATVQRSSLHARPDGVKAFAGTAIPYRSVAQELNSELTESLLCTFEIA